MKSGFILVNKEKDYTSRDVVNIATKILKTKKIGHSGTLDPFATGLLILAVNNGTKLLPFIEYETKKYIAKLKLGILTDTLDITGNIIEKKEVEKYEKLKIIEVLQSFLGKSMQLTPKYSARKIDGKKLYEYAREGREVDDIYKEINISMIQLISYEDDEIVFISEVSKGTYIRQLGLDVATKIGTIGIITELERISIGNYQVFNAKKIHDISENDILDYNVLLDSYPIYVVNNDEHKKVLNGARLNINRNENEIVIKDFNGNLLAVYEKNNNSYICKRMLFENNLG